MQYSFKISSRFRWVFCQLETLRHCLPSSVARTLDELPESLDETYERVLREIKKPNMGHALRLLQFLVVANRPLVVGELAEVLAVDFDDPDGIPKLNTSWRLEDQEQALLSSCSSLIAIVNVEDGNTMEQEYISGDDLNNENDSDKGDKNHAQIVQFSHFSVKEFLTSPRLATPIRDVSHYHIVLETAHTIMAQTCLSVLLRPDDRVDQAVVGKASPLDGYAAQYWVTHAQFGSVSFRLRGTMECLFDVDKPYFAGWLRLHNIDTYQRQSPLSAFTPDTVLEASPLYYAALCGFQDLAEHLIVKYPEQVNAIGGIYMTPVVAALSRRHFELAYLLHRHGSSVDPRDYTLWTPLHFAVSSRDVELVRVLVELEADISARSVSAQTPLHCASNVGSLGDPKLARYLLEHGADVNARASDGDTPLHRATESDEFVEVARVLIENGADIGAEDNNGSTPLQRASDYGSDKVAELLLEHGAKRKLSEA
jgi:hypothetical protein